MDAGSLDSVSLALKRWSLAISCCVLSLLLLNSSAQLHLDLYVAGLPFFLLDLSAFYVFTPLYQHSTQ